MTKLTYSDVIEFEYVTSDAGVVLSPVQQSLAVQAVSVFRELYNWVDGETSSDDIDALVADTIAALLLSSVPPKDDMNNRILLLSQFSDVTTGGAMAWVSSLGYWAQTNANGNSYRWAVTLAKGNWRLLTWCNRNNSSAILRKRVDYVAGGAIGGSDDDLYNAATITNTNFVDDFTLTTKSDVYVSMTANGKNALSSNYALQVISVELIRLPD